MSLLDTKEGRAALIWVLQLNCAEDDSVLGVPPYPMRNQPRHVQRADADITDPAKLAELIADEARRRGVKCNHARTGSFPGERADAFIWWTPQDAEGPAYLTVSLWDDVSPVRYWQMPQARAILLALLQLPDGAPREDVERVLRGER